MKAIDVEIKYSLRDYYSFIADHVQHLLRESQSKQILGMKWFTSTIGPLIACVVALWSGKLKPKYHFTISDGGISRTNGGKELIVPWGNIKQVRKYSTAFFIEMQEKGAMPIPYRSISAEQRVLLDQVFRDHTVLVTI